MQSMNKMAFSVEKRCVFGGALHQKTQSFNITQSDYSHQFESLAPAKFVIWKFMEQLRQTGSVNN
jgi:hypothetical protein